MRTADDVEPCGASPAADGSGGVPPATRSETPADAGRRRPWSAPAVAALPRLTQLTLQTGDPIGGSGNTGSGSTVF